MKLMMLLSLAALLLTGGVTNPADELSSDSSETLELTGQWGLALQPDKALGDTPRMAGIAFEDSLRLPGCLAKNKKGI